MSSCEKKKIAKLLLPCVVLLAVVIVISRRNFYRGVVAISNSIKVARNPSEELPKEPVASTTPVAPARQRNATTGFVVVSHYSDQMTGASLNLLSLQCWASTLYSRVKVVEPFLVKGSKFGFSLPSVSPVIKQDTGLEVDSEQNNVRLRDMLDIERWETQAAAHGLAPIVSWSDFLKEAPKNIILVNSRCSRKGGGDGCKSDFTRAVMKFVKNHNFTVVRRTYIKRVLYSAQRFRDLVYGTYQPSNSVVLFNYWGGIRNGQPRAHRIGLSDMEKCNRLQYSSFLFYISKTIQKDSQQYIQQYMPLARDGGYISVMFRAERFGISHGFDSMNSEQKLSTLADCVRNITGYVNKLKAQCNVQSVFLAMDCRRQGSMAFRHSTGPSFMSRELVDQMAESLYHNLYGNTSSLNDWDESFDKIATFKTAGYLAQLQKSLAASGTCLLTAGGGNFQLSAERLHNTTHKGKLCAFQVPGCM
jgi:hypothetical protein